MGIAIGWVLTVLGPLWAAMRPWLPAAGALRTFGAGLAAAAVLAGLVWAVWRVREASDREVTDARAAIIVEAANLRSENAALKAAVARQQETLRQRAEAMALGEAALARLHQEKEELRHASPNLDTLVVPPDDPWLGRPRARGSARGDAAAGPGGVRPRP
jgi:hypothetical protein